MPTLDMAELCQAPRTKDAPPGPARDTRASPAPTAPGSGSSSCQCSRGTKHGSSARGPPRPSPVLCCTRAKGGQGLLTTQCSTHTFFRSCRSHQCMSLQTLCRLRRLGARRAAHPHSDTCRMGMAQPDACTPRGAHQERTPRSHTPLRQDLCQVNTDLATRTRRQPSPTLGAAVKGICDQKAQMPRTPCGLRLPHGKKREAPLTPAPTHQTFSSGSMRGPHAGPHTPADPAPVAAPPAPPVGLRRPRGLARDGTAGGSLATHPVVELGGPVRPRGQVVDCIMSRVLGVQKQPHVLYVIFDGGLHPFRWERHH